ncbi:gamma-glutamyl kinase [Plesiocystis pacifica SIR-1]|uniref:Glutamate 5-kinase n=1 Tax=Plesiocystis pacifica SIR-1 TaxID=391625 RepID=A6GGU3_9BACT|nr:glutamate 5-kinase [Plesiocystis pacifica]EDM74884.1 gamma-glutamyl kinase [Plesiocystis pacifica SIR-1]
MSTRERVREAKRIVVKLGTHVVTHDGREFALGRVFALVESLAQLRRSGRDVVLVSSGAVGLGRRALGLEGELSLGLRQACAAAGQGRLIALYTQAFGQLDVEVAQVLLTQEDLGDPDRALCLRTTLLRLLELGAVPILNENDSVSVREIVELLEPSSTEAAAFGDNDGLSARVAAAIDADLLILATDVDGLYTANPRTDPEARRIPSLEAIDAETLARAAGSSAGGTGGMRSKLEAARNASEAGVDVLIVDGHAPRLIERALAGEDLGTFVASPERPSARRRQIALAPRCAGALILNAGAIAALLERKASLLPVGVVGIEGQFGTGALVELRDETGRARGRGLVNYDSDACRELAGKHSREIDRVLGWRGYDALITRDNLVLGDVEA